MLHSSCMLKGPTSERHDGENNLQEMPRSLVKIGMGKKSPGFISPPDILNGYLHDKNCLQSTHLSLWLEEDRDATRVQPVYLWNEMGPVPEGMILLPLSPSDQSLPWCCWRVWYSVYHLCVLEKLLCVLTDADVCMVLLGIFKHLSSVH